MSATLYFLIIIQSINSSTAGRQIYEFHSRKECEQSAHGLVAQLGPKENGSYIAFCVEKP